LPENTYTSDVSWVYPNVWASDYYYNLLIESGVGVVKNGLMERGIYHKSLIVDGLMIDRSKMGAEIFDVILNENTPIQFYTIPSNTLDGNYFAGNMGFSPSFDNPYIDGSIKRKDFDGGLISEVHGETFNFEDQTNFVVKQTLTQSSTLTADRTNKEALNSSQIKNSYGKIYIRDIVSGEISHLSAALEVQFKNKYNEYILNEIYNEVLDFNIYNDFLWIRTKNYIIFEKVAYEDTKYVYSGTGSNYKTTNNSKFCNLSIPFIFENRNYAMMAMLSGTNVDSLSFSIIPHLYKIDYNTAVITQLNTNTIPQSSHINDVTKNPVKLSRINAPHLIYNSRNDVYNIICTIEDNNEYAYIYRMKFEYDGNAVNNENVKLYASRTNMLISTISFNDNPSFSSNNIQYKDISSNTNVSFNNTVLAFS
jgi:protein associated with RNAse G/E